ncbi:MAG: reductive dehalogenase [Dehalogenimonas sp.]
MKVHSTLSRRDFMKGIALVGSGVGASAISAPIFHDLDELATTSTAIEKQPWYVTERNYLDMTTEVDWKTIKRFNRGGYDHFMAHLNQDHAMQRLQASNQTNHNNAANKKPGYTLRDYALATAGWTEVYGLVAAGMTFTADALAAFDMPPVPVPPEIRFVLNQTNNTLGVPKWDGAPEDNARMIRAFARIMGGSHVGFGNLDDKTMKLIWSTDNAIGGAPKAIVFEDVDKAYETDTKKVIPTKCKNVISVVIREDVNLGRYAPNGENTALVGKAYGQSTIFGLRMNNFLRALGYTSCTSGLTFLVPNVAWGAATGMGELNRMMSLMTPDLGAMIRNNVVFFTDLPLPVSNPIDAGMNRFCHTCLKCANTCPNGAISKEKDPSWDIVSPDNKAGNPDHLHPELFNNPGHKAWHMNHFACSDFWVTLGLWGCGMCVGSCVFSKLSDSSIHDLVKATVAKTSMFNSFFFNMDTQFGYNSTVKYDPENGYSKLNDFWNDPDKWAPLPKMGNNY